MASARAIAAGVVGKLQGTSLPRRSRRFRRRVERVLRPRWLFITALASIVWVAAVLLLWAVHAQGRPYSEAAAALAVAIAGAGVFSGLLTFFTAAYQLWRTVTPPELRTFLLPRDAAEMLIFRFKGQPPQFMVPDLCIMNVGPGPTRINRVAVGASFLYTTDWRDEAIRDALGKVVPRMMPVRSPRFNERSDAPTPWSEWTPLPATLSEQSRWELDRPFTIKESPPLLVFKLDATGETLSGPMVKAVEDAIDDGRFVLSVSVEVDSEHQLLQRTFQARIRNWHHRDVPRG